MSSSTFDLLVMELRSKGATLERAEAAARRTLGLPAQVTTADDLEDDVVDAGDRLMAALGFAIVRLSQKRRSKVTEGLPDRRYYHPRRRLFLWWEAKASWGKQSPAQRDFQELCDACGDPYVLGGIDALQAHLETIGVATFDERGRPEPT